jgi:hypothetical protein
VLPLRCPFCRRPDPPPYQGDGYARCRACGAWFRERDEARDLFFWLWGVAVSNPRYVKRVWSRLQEILGW